MIISELVLRKCTILRSNVPVLRYSVLLAAFLAAFLFLLFGWHEDTLQSLSHHSGQLRGAGASSLLLEQFGPTDRSSHLPLQVVWPEERRGTVLVDLHLDRHKAREGWPQQLSDPP